MIFIRDQDWRQLQRADGLNPDNVFNIKYSLYLSSCRLMQRWELVDVFDYHKHDVFLMILMSQLSALTAGNKTTHLYLYFLFRYGSTPPAAQILKGYIFVIVKHTLASHFSRIIL